MLLPEILSSLKWAMKNTFTYSWTIGTRLVLYKRNMVFASYMTHKAIWMQSLTMFS